MCFVCYCLTSVYHHNHILEPHRAFVSCSYESSCFDLFIHTTFDAITLRTMPVNIFENINIRTLAGACAGGVLTEGGETRAVAVRRDNAQDTGKKFGWRLFENLLCQ